MRYNQIINELKKVGYTNDYEGKSILVLKGYVFIYDEKNIEEIQNEIYQRTGLKPDNLEDPEDILFFNEEGELVNVDYVSGLIEDNVFMVIESSEMGSTSVLNKQIKKLVKELNLDGYERTMNYMSFSDEEQEETKYFSREEVLNATLDTNTLYHGTDYSSLFSIKKQGLKPTKKTNFSEILHQSYIFLTEKMTKAFFHAEKSSSNNDSVPVILEVKIPDKNKIVLDYDVAISYYGANHPLTKALGYSSIKPDINTNDFRTDLKHWEKIADKNSLNMKKGHFGYKGRIPSNHIVSVYSKAKHAALFELDLLESEEPTYNVNHLEKYDSINQFYDEVNRWIEEIQKDFDFENEK